MKRKINGIHVITFTNTGGTKYVQVISQDGQGEAFVTSIKLVR